MQDDSIDGIYDTLKQTAKISQSAGGIGLQCTMLERQELILLEQRYSQRNCSNATCFNDTARYVDQGGGKRKGSLQFT